jgi:phenylalanyl-tRNA synthetase beta chain
MQFSEHWLRTLVNPDITSDALSHLLTMAGLEIEGIERPAEALKGVDAGKSCLRFRRPEQIDLDLVDRLLADTVRLGVTSC